jgi:hypothetical protein
MASFRNFFEQLELVHQLMNEFEGVPSAQATAVVQPVSSEAKPWSAKKSEIMQMWQNMRPDTPVIMTPIMDSPTTTSHSTYGEDGIRLTGSWQFISSIMARFKEILQYENPQLKLRLVLRAVDRDRASRPDRQSYVFYCNLEGREKGKAGRPNTSPPQV